MAQPSLRIVVPRFGAEIVGGAEGLAQRTARALAARGWRVDVWSTRARDEATWSGSLPEREETDGYAVTRFPVLVRRAPRAFHQATRGFFRLPPRARPEAAWLRAQGPYSPALVQALSSAPPGPTLFIPYLYYPTVYGLPAAPHPRVLIPAAHDERPLRLAAVGRAITAADALWYSTIEERDLVEALHPRARAVPHAVGTAGIDLVAGADPERFRRRFGIDRRFLLYGGRATPSKGLDVLFDGFARLREQRDDVALVIAGDAIARPVPHGAVATGRLDEQAWRDALAASFAVTVPSTMESLSLLALEGWAAGRPCLANAASPVLRGQIARSGGGVTFSDAGELAVVAAWLLGHPSTADRMGAAGRDYVCANHQWDDVIRRLTTLLAPSQR